MRTHATKQPTERNYTHKTPVRTTSTSGRSLSTGSTMLQRKPGCACGGGCPRCQEKGLLQTKLKIGEPGDKYEQEADRVADEVMRMPEPAVQRQIEPEEEEIVQTKAIANQITPLVQRQVSPEIEEDVIQTKAIAKQTIAPASTQASSEVPSSVHKALSSPGQPLSPLTRGFMEQRFGYGFSKVRVHTDAAAEKSARDVNANAYTMGHNIVFGAGQLAPGTQEGRRLIAHELTHVVQQSGADGFHAGQSDGKSDLSPIFVISDPHALGADIVYGAGKLRNMSLRSAYELTHVVQSRLAEEPNAIRRAPGDGSGGGSKDFKIVSDVWEVEGRSVVVVERNNERTAFYKRSSDDLKGRYAGHVGPQKGDWAPFDGFGKDGHFQKEPYYRYFGDDPRYGYGKHLRTAEWLKKQRLPEAIPEHWTYVQSRIQSKGVKVLTPLKKTIPERFTQTSPTAKKASGIIQKPGKPPGGGEGGASSTRLNRGTIRNGSVTVEYDLHSPDLKNAVKLKNIDLSDYPPDKKGPINRFFNDRPVLAKFYPMGVSMAASYANNKALELIQSHFSSAIKDAWKEFDTLLPSPNSLFSSADIDGHRKAYVSTKAELRSPRLALMKIELALQLTRMEAQGKKIDAAAVRQMLQSLPDFKITAEAVMSYRDAALAYESAMIDVSKQLALNLLNLPAAQTIADDISLRAEALQRIAVNLDNSAWSLLKLPAAYLPIVGTEILSGVYLLWSLRDNFQVLGIRMGSFASAISIRAHQYEEMIESLYWHIIRIGNELNMWHWYN